MELRHPNLVHVFDINCQHGIHYLIMEYVDGKSLRDHVHDEGQLTCERSLSILRDLAHGLAAVHKMGIVHRDVKPANILVSQDGHVKLGDLGLARSETADRSITTSGAVMGTPGYMPPEQWQGAKNVTPASDVWALGATLFYMLVGEDAYGGSLEEVVRKVHLEPFPDVRKRRSGLPRKLVSVLAKCTEKDPKRRYQSASEVAEAI